MHGIIIFTAQCLLFILIAIAGIYWLTLKKVSKLRILVVGLLGSLIALLLMKLSATLFYDPRPFMTSGVVPYFPHAADNGFPSDHTSLAAVLAVTMFSVSRKLGIGLLIGAILVGSARVIAHVHSPIDIIGGLVIGSVSVSIAQLLVRLWMTRQKQQISQYKRKRRRGSAPSF